MLSSFKNFFQKIFLYLLRCVYRPLRWIDDRLGHKKEKVETLQFVANRTHSFLTENFPHKSFKNVLVFASLNLCPQKDIDKMFVLKKLGDYFDLILIVDCNLESTENLRAQCIHQQGNLIFIQRPNIGRDMGAYKLGVEVFSQKGLRFEKIFFMNDSFSLLQPDRLISWLKSNESVSVLGLSISQQFYFHLQSYFFGVSNHVFFNKHFQSFWTHYRLFNSRAHAIHKGEIALTQLCLKHNHFKIYNVEEIQKRSDFFKEKIKISKGKEQEKIDGHCAEAHTMVYERSLLSPALYIKNDLYHKRHISFVKLTLILESADYPREAKEALICRFIKRGIITSHRERLKAALGII